MEHRLQDLYDLPPQESYLLELVEQSARLEERLRTASEQFPEEFRLLLEAYIDVRDELEFQSVKRAIKFRQMGAQKETSGFF